MLKRWVWEGEKKLSQRGKKVRLVLVRKRKATLGVEERWEVVCGAAARRNRARSSASGGERRRLGERKRRRGRERKRVTESKSGDENIGER